jgi:hypothetical protein
MDLSSIFCPGEKYRVYTVRRLSFWVFSVWPEMPWETEDSNIHSTVCVGSEPLPFRYNPPGMTVNELPGARGIDCRKGESIVETI